jgi:large subunit ribosomal protein L3
MTRIFTSDGSAIPVTVVEAVPNRVTQLKTIENDGYEAIQVAYGQTGQNKHNKPTRGHVAKAAVEAGTGFREWRLNKVELKKFSLAQEITVDIFQIGQKVDVTGVTRGKGYAGVIKRHHFSTQDATHGNSLSHRAPGSIGQRQTPGRVFKGKRMAGHLGNASCTIQTLEIIQINKEKNLLMIKGAVPGSPGGEVIVRPAQKA